ncbi:hypothetical protein [Staphylococcus epidermidis]|nr:hypothetical protein [Staphylococcus epidermidis]
MLGGNVGNGYSRLKEAGLCMKEGIGYIEEGEMEKVEGYKGV